jgi:hypothetical protein
MNGHARNRQRRLLQQLRRESQAASERRVRVCDDLTPALADLVRLAYRWPRATALRLGGIRFPVSEGCFRNVIDPETGRALVGVSA